jgi:predicted dehydrogenase/NADPH:quinone reductase-like Zn-dependent oxidoreductase
VLLSAAGVHVADVPAPRVSARSLLVAVECSCISPGTELASLGQASQPLYRRVIAQPDRARRVLVAALTRGVRATVADVKSRLGRGSPTGYSAAGTVIEVGADASGFRAGDLVAAAGAGIANHAAIIDVPFNLAVKVPSGVSAEHASTVALGAIALQGIRRAAPTLGETCVVVGLGTLGQLTVQMLQAQGCVAIGVDIRPDRVRLAMDNGLGIGVVAGEGDWVDEVTRATCRAGADAVLVTADTRDSDLLAMAIRACRRKGRVVVVGNVGMNLCRDDLYAKEIDLLISTSYGPGRYDPAYEIEGHDYPLAYVRWTENRNMQAYLAMLDRGQIRVGHLAGAPVAVDDAAQAYAMLASGHGAPLALLRFQAQADVPAADRIVRLRATPVHDRRIGVAVVGAGAFAQSVHLPNLAKLGAHYRLCAVANRSGAIAKALADQYVADYATTDFDAVLSDPGIDLILVATRHHLHAPMVLAALEAGKNVFVEKPLALTAAEVDRIEALYRNNASAPLLMTGFNRRFSESVARIHAITGRRTGPLMISYRMNAGYLPPGHWVHGPQGGGRNCGEACHVYDVFDFLIGAAVSRVDAASTVVSGQWPSSDNFVATLSYEDGSVCTLLYTSMGHDSHPKETMDVYCDGAVISLDDYRSVQMKGPTSWTWRARAPEKGHLAELEALAASLQSGGEWPIPLESQLRVTRTALKVQQRLEAGTCPT